jgi:hypothetical protein
MSRKVKQSGGLLEAVIQNQTAGADSYRQHRVKAYKNLQTMKKLDWEPTAKTGATKREEWIKEVKALRLKEGYNWKTSLQEASKRRKENINGYKTVVERVQSGYTGRIADNVECNNPDICPGKYTKAVATASDGSIIYRPNAHKSRVHLTTSAATKVLRDYYKSRAHTYKDGLKGATTAMRKDISRKNHRSIVQSPCPTKLTSIKTKKGIVYERNIIDKEHPAYAACRSNWLYRDSPNAFDFETVDYGEGRASPAYGKYNLPKTHKKKST